MKKRWVILGSVLILAAIGNIIENEPVTKEEPKTEEVVKKEEPVKKEKPAPEPKEDRSDVLADKYLQILKENYEGTSTVTYNKETGMFKITPTDDDLKLSFAMIASGDIDISMWQTIVNSMLEMSKTMGPDYSIALVNPANTELILLSVMDGIVVYNFMEGE